MDIRHDTHDTLTPERAADLLGVSPRTVRRWISCGKLAGRVSPCATTRAAVDALRRQQQARSGEVVSAHDGAADSADKGRHEDPRMAGVTPAADVAYVVDMLAGRVQDLAREVGRLEAALAQARAGRHGHKGQAAGTLSRLVPWLRR